MKAFMNWSGGKDSALALHTARQQGINVTALLTSVNKATGRVSMHGVRKAMVEKQAAAIGLPLRTIELPEMPGMESYEQAMHNTHIELQSQSFTQAVYGDIFLEDLKAYREALLEKDGLQCLFPLWKKNTGELLQQFIRDGFKAIIVCVNSTVLDESFCGRLLDESFLADLPNTVDPCGENGEYHSFVFDGPLFSAPVDFTTGEIVFKEYPAPVIGDSFTVAQPKTGFYFQDLVAC